MERTGDVQPVSRALDLLKRLGSSDEGQRLSELARAAGLAVSTAHRLLTTMQQAGFVNFDPVRSEWHVGREAFAVGAAYIQRRDFVAPAMRKALLATWTDEQIAVFCKRNGFRKLTPNSRRNLASLMADIKSIRKRCFAIDDEEHVAGLRCVAAVVCSPQGDAICALSVSGLSNRLSSTRANDVAARVVAASREFAEKIGLR